MMIQAAFFDLRFYVNFTMKIKLILPISLFMMALFAANICAGEAPTIYIDLSEGGSESSRQVAKLKNYLKKGQCDAVIETGFKSPVKNYDLYFFPLSPDKDWLSQTRLTFALQADTRNGVNTRGVIMVRANTNLKSLTSLKDEPISFLNRYSRLGFLDQQQMFQTADVKLSDQKNFATDNHSAAMTLLLHKDVFAAFVEASLAEQWGEANGLKVLAHGPERKVGGFYISEGVNRLDLKACLISLASINRSQRKGKSLLRLFPDWVTSFKSLESSFNK